MKVWTVSSRDDTDCGDDFFVEGSYTTRDLAVEKAVDYVLNRIEFLDGFAEAMADDENHRSASQYFSKRKSDGGTYVRKGCVGKLRTYLAERFGSTGEYCVLSGNNCWRFSVDENELSGEVWRTATFGDSDNEDPEFTTPWPEAFSTKEAALKEFVDYVKDLFRQHGMRFTAKCEAYIRKQVDEDGKVQVDLNDGCCVCLVLSHDDAVNVKG